MQLAHFIRSSIERQWYGKPTWLWAFAPLVPLFSFLSKRRRKKLEAQNEVLPVPIIVVGNITAGGTGKTPFVIALCEQLKHAGWKPAVISRGYASQSDGLAVVDDTLAPHDSARRFGDEPTLIARQTACQVVVSADRLAAARYAIEQLKCDLVVSDDGLQHYRLPRQLEFAVVDAKRCMGNTYLMPIGPLREAPSRLNEVDFIILNGQLDNTACRAALPAQNTPVFAMQLVPLHWRNIATGEIVALKVFDFQNAVALAGIGNPQRFQDTLKDLGFLGAFYAFPDHHSFVAADLVFAEGKRVVMTAKDAVKCEVFCHGGEPLIKDAWCLDVVAELSDEASEQISTRCERLKKHVI